MKQVLDAQGGYAKVKSFKDSMDVFGKNNQYVADQVGVQTWAQWYPNVLANTASKVSLAAVPIKTTSGKTLAMAGGTSFAIPKSGRTPRPPAPGRLRPRRRTPGSRPARRGPRPSRRTIPSRPA